MEKRHEKRGRSKRAARRRGIARTARDQPQRPEHHGNRYGRSEQARQAVLEAADNLLSELGFAAVTMERIAARAGVGKQTVYRWWPSKTDVLMDAFLDDALGDLKPRDTGSLRNDLRAYLNKLARFLTETDAGRVFRALAGQAQHDADICRRFRKDYLRLQRRTDRLPFERAVERGELTPDTDIELAVDRLVGPIYYRVLVTGDPVGSKFTNSLVAAFLDGM